MKDLFKIKYEMHKGVNYLFYAIVIGIGIAIGLGFKFLFNFNIPQPVNDFLKTLVY